MRICIRFKCFAAKHRRDYNKGIICWSSDKSVLSDVCLKAQDRFKRQIEFQRLLQRTRSDWLNKICPLRTAHQKRCWSNARSIFSYKETGCAQRPITDSFVKRNQLRSRRPDSQNILLSVTGSIVSIAKNNCNVNWYYLIFNRFSSSSWNTVIHSLVMVPNKANRRSSPV